MEKLSVNYTTLGNSSGITTKFDGDGTEFEAEVAAITREQVDTHVNAHLAPISQQLVELATLVQSPTHKPSNKIILTAIS